MHVISPCRSTRSLHVGGDREGVRVARQAQDAGRRSLRALAEGGQGPRVERTDGRAYYFVLSAEPIIFPESNKTSPYIACHFSVSLYTLAGDHRERFRRHGATGRRSLRPLAEVSRVERTNGHARMSFQ